ncbi:MAG: addiction module protein [Verrucomicrobiales bacterium]|nr:addiction module protein [Verrucomicrobiales bacterium]
MTTEELRQLPTEEKVLMMETLWDDLREHFDNAEVSDDQKRLLDQRRTRVESGESRLLEWDEVKSSIGRS